MKKNIIVLVTGIFFNLSFAQYEDQLARAFSKGNKVTFSKVFIEKFVDNIDRSYQIDDFKGSPYTSNEFAPAILFYNKEEIGAIYYRYNALNEEIETKNTMIPGETIKGLKKDKSIIVLVNGEKMSFKTFTTSKEKTFNGYLTTLVGNGKYILYHRVHVIYKEGEKAKNSFVSAVPNKFTHFTEYYYQVNNVNRVDEIPLSKGKFLNLFKDGEKENLKIFIKENKLNIKKKKDLITVFEFLNKK